MVSTLEQMRQNFPQQNEQIGRSLAEGRKAQLRAAVTGTAAAGQPMARGAIGQAAAQGIQQQSQPMLQARQQTLQQQGQLGQLALQEEGLQKQQQLFERNKSLQSQQRENVLALNNLQQGLGDSLFTRQMQFEKDQMGRVRFTEKQLMDYKIASATRREQLANYEQQVAQASQLRMQMLKQAYAVLSQELQQNFAKTEQDKDLAQENRLYAARKEIERKMQEEQNKQAERAAMFGAAGKVVFGVAGGVVGGIFGGPAGAAAGASAGTAIGGAVGGGLASATAPSINKPTAQGMGVSPGRSDIGPTTYGR